MRERELFLAALEIEDPAARLAHLKVECADDAELLARVESLLASHEGQSQFLNTPVVEQIADGSEAGAAVTLLVGNGSTQDEDQNENDGPDATTAFQPNGPANMTKHDDDSEVEIPLGYLEPSTKPGSMGRLGHYEVLEVIGRGAFGTVLRAFDEKLHRVVAIKVMAPELASTSPARKRFIREAQASAAIRHEHVVSVYAVEEKPLPYLVMEFIPGLTLQQRLDERGPLDVPTVLRIGKQIAEGLAAAHAQDLIHRDIKPANILLETGAREMVKVTDFGLARAADDASLTQSGTIAGTPMYMAPEQAMGQKLDQRADLFSFGSVLYQMVSGRPPFRAATTLAVLKRLAEDTPRPIREIIPEAPQWLCDIITKLHAKNPDQRYQTAREIADVLADCEAQLKAHAGLKDLSRIPRTKSPSAGWWKWIAAAVVVLPLVAFGLSAFNRPAAQPNVARNEIAEPATNPDPMKPVSETTPDEVTHPIAPESAGWVQLFNGKDLSGWKTHDLAPGNWRVEDGAIVGRGDKSFLSFLFSESEYADFHLRVEAKINAIGDSGVNFRAPFDVRLWKGGPNIWLAGGYEAQIGVRSNDRNHTGSLFCAAEPPLMPLIQQGPLMPHRPDEWFVLEVIAQGNRIQTFVNGKKTADYVDEQRRYDRGHLALHTWGRNITFVQFRKIEIKELPAVSVVKQEPPPLADGWVRLFNGKDKTGWKTHPDQGGHWEVKDGILIGSTRQSYLFSERGDYGNFHLRAEAKINLGGDSGIAFRVPFALRSGELAWQVGPPRGFEAELHKNLTHPNPTGSVWELHSGVRPTVLGRAAADSLTRPDEWFTFEVIATDNHFVTKINGIEAANCNDPLDRLQTGHLALQVWNANTMVQFRKIEIKELPSSAPTPQPQFYSSNEWIDVIPLIVPQLDKWDMRLTGKNEWRIEQGELVVGSADEKPSKLLFPLDADFFPSFECELELTRRTGEHGFNLNFPTANGDTPLTFDFPAKRGVFVRHLRNGIMPISESPQIETEKRTTIRVEVRRQQGGDQISVWNKDAVVGTWKGDRNELASVNNEGYEHRRRLSLWIHGGHNEFVFHRIRIRMLEGGTAESLRPVPSTPLVPEAKQEPPTTFKNSIGMEFVIVPKGKSWLGGGKDKLGDKEVEIPADFHLGKYEVTQEEWDKVMGENPSHFSRTGSSMDAVKDIKEADLKRFPVEGVSWHQCQIFVAKLNQLEKDKGWVYRLPKEAEWEYACRGGPMADKRDSAFDFYFVKPTNTLSSEMANFNKGVGRTCKVGSYESNHLGLFDMHGNVWEWCDDTEKVADGTSERVYRGGCWEFAAGDSRAAHRYTLPPSFPGNSLLGLRLARVPSGAPSPEAKTPPLAVAPFTDADVQRIAALPAAEQVEEVRMELKKRNSGFDGTLTPTIENDVVTGLEFFTNHVSDISPVRAFPHLTSLNCRADGSIVGMVSDLKSLKGMPLVRLTLSVNPVSDLTPLKGMPLTDLHIDNSHVADLSPLEGMQLKVLNCSYTKVSSLAPLKGMPLIILWCNNTEIANLSPVKGMPLEWITIHGTKVTDLSPLKGMPLTEIYLDFDRERDGDLLRSLTTLQKINDKLSDEFWKGADEK